MREDSSASFSACQQDCDASEYIYYSAKPQLPVMKVHEHGGGSGFIQGRGKMRTEGVGLKNGRYDCSCERVIKVTIHRIIANIYFPKRLQ